VEKVKTNISAFYAIFGMIPVLIVLGMAIILGLYARQLSHQVKEQMALEVILTDNIKAETAGKLLDKLQQKPYAKKVVFVSKSQAAELLKKEMGEDFTDILGFNPLYAKFDVFVKENFSAPAALQNIKEELQNEEGVVEVNAQLNIAAAIDSFIQKVTYFLSAIALLLLVFSVLLIFNTIRFSIFANRTLVRSMLLVGATRWFITKPYLEKAFIMGFISSLAAVLVVFGLLVYVNYEFPELALRSDLINFVSVAVGILVFAVLVSVVSTYFALRKYLSYSTEQYY
jgi:cell division transport system permease protein